MKTRDDRPKGSSQELRRAAIVYARVSSKEQEKEGYSIPAQLKSLYGYAKTADLRVLSEGNGTNGFQRNGCVYEENAFLSTYPR
jgi:predicted site-specific integrase-resolvase